MKRRVLVVDDDPGIREALPMLLEDAGWDAIAADGGREALARLGKESFSLVLSDLAMPGMDGLELLSRIRGTYPDLPVVMISAHGDLQTAVQAVREGAYDYLLKPVEEERLLHTIERAIEHSRLRRDYDAVRADAAPSEPLLGDSPPMVRLRRDISRAAPSDARILILGENGTGKELVARAVHEQSRRAERPFVKLNSAAIPGELIESELFGHEAGSFTGAKAAKTGKLEMAGTGTLFLDEIGDMSTKTQAKLLRVLASGEYERVGGSRTLHFEARLVTATNHDLAASIAEGEFREDLYHRVAVIPLRVPPLRERGDDIVLLALHFLGGFSADTGREPPRLTDAARDLLRAYPWPGNVRELRNLMERVAIMHPSGTLDGPDLESLLAFAPAAESPRSSGKPLREKDKLERKMIVKVLEESGWNVADAARRLEITRPSMHRKMRRLDISRPGDGS